MARSQWKRYLLIGRRPMLIRNPWKKWIGSRSLRLTKPCARISLSKADLTDNAFLASARTSCSYQPCSMTKTWSNLEETTCKSCTHLSKKPLIRKMPMEWRQRSNWWARLLTVSILERKTLWLVSSRSMKHIKAALASKVCQCSHRQPVESSKATR